MEAAKPRKRLKTKEEFTAQKVLQKRNHLGKWQYLLECATGNNETIRTWFSTDTLIDINQSDQIEEIVGVGKGNTGAVMLLVKWKSCETSYIPVTIANSIAPLKVIKYYEDNIHLFEKQPQQSAQQQQPQQQQPIQVLIPQQYTQPGTGWAVLQTIEPTEQVQQVQSLEQTQEEVAKEPQPSNETPDQPSQPHEEAHEDDHPNTSQPHEEAQPPPLENQQQPQQTTENQ